MNKDLNVPISVVAGDYELRYLVTDRESNVFYSARTEVSVIDDYSRGVMVLSNVDGEAELSFINAANTLRTHVYEEANGQSAGRNPSGIFYIGNDLTNALVVIATEEGSKLLNPTDFSDFFDFSELFYFPPEPGILQGKVNCSLSMTPQEFLIIDGKVYPRSLSTDGLYQPCNVQLKGDCEILPFLMGEIMTNVLFYDQKGQRFMYASTVGRNILAVSATPTGSFDVANTGMDMIWGFSSSSILSSAICAVMEDGGGLRYLVTATGTYSMDMTTFEVVVLVSPGMKLPMDGEAAEASAFAISTVDSRNLFYAYGNKIACMSSVTGEILATYEGIPNGLQIDYMEFDRTEDAGRLWVGVSDGSGAANSGSIYFLKTTDGITLTEEIRFENVCGKVVDFDYKP